MIGLDDVYKVVVAMAPLYVALMLGYVSVKWWHMFTHDQCDAINRLNCYFILPLFTFEFTTQVNPFEMNFRFIAAEIISKSIILILIAIWANCTSKGNYPWSVTTFSLSALSNPLVVGVPLMKAMYGPLGENIVIQLSILQAIVWVMVLLFMLELQLAKKELSTSKKSVVHAADLEGNVSTTTSGGDDLSRSSSTRALPFLALMKIVGVKLAKNPNSYACIFGVVWALISNRWNLQMPSIVEGSILIMSKAGSGVAMFCMGLFMALQEKVIACGTRLALYGMVLRFVVAPATAALCCFAVGLRGTVLRIAIVQAGLPQSITSFLLANEYGVHANVLSTAVIFGTIMSLPVLIAYYAVLDFIH